MKQNIKTNSKSEIGKNSSNKSIDSEGSFMEKQFQESQFPNPTNWSDTDSDESINSINSTSQVSNEKTEKLCVKRKEIDTTVMNEETKIINDEKILLINNDCRTKKKCKRRKIINDSITNTETKNTSEDVPEKRNANKNLEALTPKCKCCNSAFDMTDYSKKSPVMSMTCFHTICHGCIINSIDLQRIKLRRKNVNTTPCPMDDCKAPKAFRNDCVNWNLALMNFFQNVFGK